MLSKKSTLSSVSLSALAASASLVLLSVPASAQDMAAAGPADTAVEATDSGEIVVTARKRSESVLKTPVALSVLTSDDIAKKGITSLTDIAANTPGVNINNNSSGRSDRSFQQIIIRGFTPSSSLATTVSTFIDGAPVSSPTALTTITDPARVEVLKGPQSAYFGRNTFAGAVNVVSKLPTGEWGGSVAGMVGTRSNYRLHADLEGPILGDALTFRLSADKFSKGGSYTNTFTGGKLGDQSSKSVSGLIVAKPTSNLTLKFFGIYSQDNDGPAAQGLISAYGLKTASGTTIVADQHNCTLPGLVSGTPGSALAAGGRNYICGKAPGLSAQSPSSNTGLTTNVRDFLAKSNGRIFSGKDGVQDYGLLRRFYHLHANVDYEIPGTGLTFSSITAMNREGYSTLVDLDNWGSTAIPVSAAAGAAYFDFPYLIERKSEDFSQEVRLAYDKGGPFKATIGASYLHGWGSSDLGGGSGSLTNVSPSVAGTSRARTRGAFYALSYRLFDKLTLNAEGRYQIDTLYAYIPPAGLVVTTNDSVLPAGSYAGNALLARQTFRNFLPRLIAQYDFDRNTMVYASWAKGVNPGGFNTGFLTAPAATVRAAAAAGITVQVRPEKVTNYEVGIKGRLLDGRLRYTLDGYYAQWRDQVNQIQLASFDPVSGQPQFIQGSSNTGDVNMKGIEFDGNYAVSRLISINAAGALTDSTILRQVVPTVTILSGVTNFNGKEMPNTSKWSASAGVQFGGHIRDMGDATWFARADYTYKSGVWSNAANIVRTPDYHNVNLRVGTTKGPMSVDVFVNNLFDSTTYTSIGDQNLFTPSFAYTGAYSALIVGLREKRTIGLQAKYKF